MLSKLFGLFKSKPVEKQPEPPLVQLGPEKTEITIEYELNTTPTVQQLEDAFKEEELVGNPIPVPGTIGGATIQFSEEPKYEKDDGPLTEEQKEMIIETFPESVNPLPTPKKRTPRKTVAKKATKNGKSNS
jgi:hypothetical protein